MSPEKWTELLSTMTGRLALTRESEAAALAEYTTFPGDHVEVGCLWGATAIIVAVAKKEAGYPGMVYTIDPMRGGWWDTMDPAVDLRPTAGLVMKNFNQYDVADRIRIIRTLSYPWPLPGIHPVTALIDGDHSYQAALSDWNNLSPITEKYILMHDYAASHPGVVRAIDEHAKKDKNWRYIKVVNSVAVFERVG